ncbi:class I SAM-dependent methyltransferase [Okeania hirsuta]|uniref:Class I SAM-dependent methyltransferase n=1 Tax=Okeania hirsuta TaxID=1458930 RepID=A0A3N6R4F4_9CYAN|nr:class I SAM-dependent methyltransferase [Okeania hirsuta]RQH39574.1 class I SAM-dependent methyltransferase [Okeania hirsuta]
MIEAAKSKIADNYQGNLEFINQDYGLPEWVNKLHRKAPFDIVVSGFSIHHQPDIRKQEIYQEIYQLLKPGGLFLNLEHVASPSKLIEQLFDELYHVPLRGNVILAIFSHLKMTSALILEIYFLADSLITDN